MKYLNGVSKPESKTWFLKLPPETEEVNEFHLREFYRTLFERQEIWVNRNIKKQQRPWSRDRILSDYKFTNSYRELDRSSQFVINNIIIPHRGKRTAEDDLNLVWKMIVYRFYNKPDAFLSGDIVLPNYYDFDAKKLWSQTVNYREKIDNPWHTAYLMNLAFAPMPENYKNLNRGLWKDYAYIHVCFEQIHKLLPEILRKIKVCDTPREMCKLLEKFHAVSDFTSHEFFIDFCYVEKYTDKALIAFNQDDYTNVGPGCSLGLRLIFPSLKNQIEGLYLLRDYALYAWKDMRLNFKFLTIEDSDDSNEHYNFSEDEKHFNLCLTHMEFWCCEYSKYWKMSIGEGKQRTKFIPSN
jgi:hypothetical protein